MTIAPGSFETHLTFAALTPTQVEAARAWAAKWDCKFLQIELDRGSTPTQPMLTWHTRGTLEDQRSFAEERANTLRQVGLPVTRIKLEVATDHSGVPVLNRYRGDDCYFEYHIKLLLDSDVDIARLSTLVQVYDARLSCNAFKHRADDKQERFVTLRCHSVGLYTANMRFRELNDSLHKSGYPILDVEEEYVVYDSDVSVDAGWLHSQEVYTMSRASTGKARIFDPALKHLTEALRPNDPTLSEAELGWWFDARRHALDYVLRAIAESPCGDKLMLRGSRLIKAWLAESREPRDLDFVVTDIGMSLNDPSARELQKQIIEAVAWEGPSEVAVSFAKNELTYEDIWTYERAQGRRIVFPWKTHGLPGGTIQVDIVFGERLLEPARWQAIPLANESCVSLHAASSGQSLAWKLLWLYSDMHPQGKDLYDAVLLAEHQSVSYALFHRTMLEFEHPHACDWKSARAFCDDLRDIDWKNFVLEYPNITGSSSDWLTRLEVALEPTFNMQDPISKSNRVSNDWLTRDVVDLACAIQGRHSFEDLPILADALEEAGCDDVAMLAHCRAGGPHSQGCFVIERLLETSPVNGAS